MLFENQIIAGEHFSNFYLSSPIAVVAIQSNFTETWSQKITNSHILSLSATPSVTFHLHHQLRTLLDSFTSDQFLLLRKKSFKQFRLQFFSELRKQFGDPRVKSWRDSKPLEKWILSLIYLRSFWKALMTTVVNLLGRPKRARERENLSEIFWTKTQLSTKKRDSQ